MSSRTIALAICLIVGAPACGKQAKSKESSAQAEPKATLKAAEAAPKPLDAKALFKGRCSVCHGETGLGNGPGAAALTPKPRDFSDPEWQKSVQDADIAKIIQEGGAKVGKSPAMPPNPDLNDQPQVVADLVKIIRGFK